MKPAKEGERKDGGNLSEIERESIYNMLCNYWRSRTTIKFIETADN